MLRGIVRAIATCLLLTGLILQTATATGDATASPASPTSPTATAPPATTAPATTTPPTNTTPPATTAPPTTTPPAATPPPATTTPPATTPPTGSTPSGSTGPTAAKSPYVDLPPTHWAYPMVMKLLNAGVLTLDPTGHFRPDDPIRRSELFKMVMVARGIDSGTTCLGQFRDVSCSAWYGPMAENAYRLALADLQGEDKLAPEGQVTRQELFAVIVRAAGERWDAAKIGWQQISAILKPASDGDQISDWARPYLALALRDGLMSGYDDGTLRPGQITTRAEAATVISRILLPGDSAKTATVDGRKVVYTKQINMVASEYTTGESGVGWTTYTGLTVRRGTVAVDPSVIPLGRLLYVEGYGYAVAADIGGAIKGNRIDLFTWDAHDAAITFGLQSRKVYVLP